MKPTNLLLAGLLVLFFGAGAFYSMSHPEQPLPPQEAPLPDRLVFTAWSERGQVRVVENLDGTGQYVITLYDPTRSHYDQVGTRGTLSPEQVGALGDYLASAGSGPEKEPGAGYLKLRYKTARVSQPIDSARLQSLLENAPGIGEVCRRGPTLKPPRHSNQE